MITLGPPQADIRVFTFKEGLLSPVAHDLQIKVNRFEIAINQSNSSIHARIEADSLEVVAAMREGQPDPKALSASNKAEIQENIRKDVLHSGKFGSVVFESTSMSDTEVRGRLSLHGVTREIRIPTRQEDGRRVGEVRLDQRDFNIKPFAALLGALKVQPEVLVRVSLPWPP